MIDFLKLILAPYEMILSFFDVPGRDTYKPDNDLYAKAEKLQVRTKQFRLEEPTKDRADADVLERLQERPARQA